MVVSGAATRERLVSLAWAAIPTIRRYVNCRVLYDTTLFCSVAITVTVVFNESPNRK